MISEPIIQFFAQFIEKELGIIYSEANYFQLKTRLEEVAKALSLPSVDALWSEARHGMDSLRKQVLLDVATNNETSFFRDRLMFDCLEQNILPSLYEEKKLPLKIWSAASSYGQEPYSLSMILSELAEKGKSVPAQILATDISQRALTRAKSGKYSHLEVQRGLSAPVLVKYFRQDEEGWWKISDKERARIEFKTQNLLHPFNFLDKFDLVLCRNVLIYQNLQSKTNILERISQQIRPGGILVMGTGETLLGLCEGYESVKMGSVVVYKRLKSDVRIAV
ncbi:MAG: protein-glutamate O-methyltransferase CheR [Bacteriovoracaceae bacterium]|nr:protein-glutamate O-methyltransferase CheR [Bacteriovoracaceae bacterium]